MAGMAYKIIGTQRRKNILVRYYRLTQYSRKVLTSCDTLSIAILKEFFCFTFLVEERTFPHQKQFNNILNSHGSITIILLLTLVIRFKSNHNLLMQELLQSLWELVILLCFLIFVGSQLKRLTICITGPLYLFKKDYLW